MFNTGSRTMESVLLEHAGHDVELYEFTEDNKNGVVLWCKDCRENIIKHFLSIPWEVQLEQTNQRAEGMDAEPFEQWKAGFIQNCLDTDGVFPEYQDDEWQEVYNEYLDCLETQRGTTRTERPTRNTGWDTSDREWTT